MQLKDQILLYDNLNLLNIPCFSCSKTNHFYNDCPLVHFTPDREFIIKRHLFSGPQKERVIYSRKKKKKLNSLVLYKKIQGIKLNISENSDDDSEINEKLYFSECNSLANLEEEKENVEEFADKQPLKSCLSKSLKEQSFVLKKIEKEVSNKVIENLYDYNFENLKEYQFYSVQNNIQNIISKMKNKSPRLRKKLGMNSGLLKK